jgi:hypothetical protein
VGKGVSETLFEYYDTIPYPHGFRVPNFAKFNGDDNKTTFKHIGQFLAQVNDVGVTPPS